jgi:hypothetical protein
MLSSTASDALPDAYRLVSHHQNAHSTLVDILDQEKVGRLVEEADVVVRYVEATQDKNNYVTGPVSLVCCRRFVTLQLLSSVSNIGNIS